MVKVLNSRGIESLFPIQVATFDAIYNGAELIGRARTGTGKTLAFSLPVVEKLHLEAPFTGYGRKPKVLVLAPTRELAKQVAEEFQSIGVLLKTLCIYGGTPYDPQESTLRRGVDVVVGTPGRIKDHLDRGTLKLTDLKYVILDEADEMLNFGFAEDIEAILDFVPAENDKQTLLFSATVP